MRTLSLLALGLAVLAGCDFAPTLDIETPAFEPALTVTTVLFADSTVRVRVTRARDPYSAQLVPLNGRLGFATVTDARVTLSRDGVPEALTFASEQCVDGFDFETQQEVFAECGFYVSAAPVVGGSTYALRAEAPGLPTAEATVRVPAVVPATATMVPGTPVDGQRTNRITLRFRDPAGPGDVYALDALITSAYEQQTTFCDASGCRDTTFTARFAGQTSFTTADPVLLAGLRGLPGGSNVVTFTDELFDGQDRSFTIDARVYNEGPDGSARRTVRLVALDRTLLDAYQQSEFSLGGDNPFQEPSDLPSNVRGGYGLVGAAAVTEVDLGAP